MASISSRLPEEASVGAVEAQWPGRGQAWYTIWLIALVTLLSNIDRSVINLLIEPMKQDLHLTDTQASLIVGTAFSLFYFLTGFPMSRVSDSRSRKLVLAGGLFVWSGATVLCGFMRSFWQLFFARGLVGAAESVPGPASLSMISDLVPREKLPRAFAVYQLGISFGQSGALIIGGLLLGYFASFDMLSLPFVGEMRPWELVFLCCGLPGLLVCLLWLGTVKEPKRRNRVRKGSVSLGEFGRFLVQHWKLYLPMFLSIAIGAIEIMGASTWRVSMFQRSYGWLPSETGPLFGSVALVTTPISLMAGTWLAEHLLKRRDPRAMVRVSVIASTLGLPFVVAAPLMPNGWLCFGLLAIYMFIHGMSTPAINSAIQFVTPNEMRAQVSSLYLYTISVIGTAFGPLVVALVGDYIFRDEAQLYLAMSSFALVLGPVAILLMWLAMHAYGRVIEAQQAAGTA